VQQIILRENIFVIFGSSANNDENFISLTVPQNNSCNNSADGQTDIPEKLKTQQSMTSKLLRK
jgi:hypothetical protein